MKAAIITIGDEILIGQITDTNSVWIARQLNDLGIVVGEMVSISDDPDHIRITLDRLIGRYKLLLMTGGLGPTKDDLTKQTLAAYFGGRLVMDDEILHDIEDFFKARGRKIIESNRMQAMIPDTCEAFPNHHGTAPGMWFEKDDTILISMPGVPYEMKGIMVDYTIPRLKELFKFPEVVHKVIMTQGVPESYLAEMIRNWESNLPACVKLAYLPRPGIVRLRLTVTGKCVKESKVILDKLINELSGIISVHIFGFDDEQLEKVLGRELRERKLGLAVAESCTGGNIAHLITSVPGSSDYFRGSMVAYHNEIKSDILDVQQSSLNEFGAVSQSVAEQMVMGVMKSFGAETGIATTGIAGPGGGTTEKPIGTTWISVAYGDNIYSEEFHFGGTRERIIEQASITALNLLRRLVIGTL
jgi:nicotinamide-nucleotide amidase